MFGLSKEMSHNLTFLIKEMVYSHLSFRQSMFSGVTRGQEICLKKDSGKGTVKRLL